MTTWFDEGSGQPVDVEVILDGTGVTEALAKLVQLGALVSIGTTSDGGSLGLTVTLDGKWRRQYGRSVEDFAEWLGGALTAVEAQGGRPTASSGRRQRQRGPRGG